MSHCSVCVYAFHPPMCSLFRCFDFWPFFSLFLAPFFFPSPYLALPYQSHLLFHRFHSSILLMAGLVPRSLPSSRSLFLFLSLSCASSICLFHAVFVFNQLPPTVLSSLLDPFILRPFSSLCYLLLTPPFSTLPSSNVFSPPSTSCNFCRLCLSTSISLTSDLPPPQHTHSLHHCPSPPPISLCLSCFPVTLMEAQ